jgi:hypothetical protein
MNENRLSDYLDPIRQAATDATIQRAAWRGPSKTTAGNCASRSTRCCRARRGFIRAIWFFCGRFARFTGVYSLTPK